MWNSRCCSEADNGLVVLRWLFHSRESTGDEATRIATPRTASSSMMIKCDRYQLKPRQENEGNGKDRGIILCNKSLRRIESR